MLVIVTWWWHWPTLYQNSVNLWRAWILLDRIFYCVACTWVVIGCQQPWSAVAGATFTNEFAPYANAMQAPPLNLTQETYSSKVLQTFIRAMHICNYACAWLMPWCNMIMNCHCWCVQFVNCTGHKFSIKGLFPDFSIIFQWRRQ